MSPPKVRRAGSVSSLSPQGSWLCAPVLLAIALVALPHSATLLHAQQQQSDADQLERFLSRLGLVDLQILHLEQSLERQTDPAARLKTARQLADLYAERLMEAGDDAQRYQDLLAGIEQLTSRFPQANTTALQVMLLQADYNRAEALIGQWIGDADNTQARDQAREILIRIAPQLQTHQKELNDQVDTLLKAIEDLGEGDLRDEKEQELSRVQAVAGRATYFAAWSSYYLGLVREGTAETNFQQAREVFRKLLGLTDEDQDYTKVDVSWLGLESIWRTRAVIGLGLAEAAAGNLEASQAVFAWLESSVVAPQIRDQAAYWYVQGLINADKLAAAADYAAEQIEKFAGQASQGKVSLCVALIRAGFGAAQSSDQARSLGMLGIRGLAKLRQFAILKTFVDQYDIDLSEGDSFYLTFIRGQQQFDAAERSQQPADYQAAIDTLTKALATEEANRDAGFAAQCRYNLGWCHYRLGDYSQAAREFEQAITGLKLFDAETAAQSAWLAFASYRQMVDSSPTAASSAIGVLELLKREFPQSKFAGRADYQIAKLRSQASTPEESIAALKKIKPAESNYLSARYDLCLLLHRQWRSERDDADAAPAAFVELREAVDVYWKAAGDGETSRRLSAALKVVDAALGSQPPNRSLAESYLDRASALAAGLPEQDLAVVEFHYQSLQLARAVDDAAARSTHAAWLVEHARGSAYELPALVTAASSLDAQIKAADQGELPSLHAQALDVYRRLAETLGDAPQVLENQKNARVAHSKWAHYAALAGEHDEAAAILNKLLSTFPKDRNYLRRAGLANFNAGHYAASLDQWQTLLRGLPAGSDGWLEAKYHQIASLANTDPIAAARVFKQFQLLYPDSGGDAWRGKFQGLGRQLP